MEEYENNLKMNALLRLLVLPLTDSEYAELEKEILTCGSRKPIQSWRGYIVSEFERAEICQRHSIPFEISKINFCTEIEVVEQICRRELKERVLPGDMRRYLIGKLYIAEKIIAAHRAAGTDRYKERHNREVSRSKSPADVRIGHIRDRMGGEYQLSPATISRYAAYAEGIDNIFDENPEMAKQILSGAAKISVESICNYGRASDNAVEYHFTKNGARNIQEILAVGPSVKDMPEFDPDAEISSLSLTIPSWIQSLVRIRSTVKLQMITDTGRGHLKMGLCQLISEANKLYSVLEVK